MKKLLILAFTLLLAIPGLSQAKTGHPKGYERARGNSITVSEPLGWPVSVSAKVGKLDGSIESLPGMAVIRVKAYKSWYNMFTNIPATTTLTIMGLPANKELHIYTNGYRVHDIITTSPSGALTLNRPTGRGMQVIIKDRPSTKTIRNNSTGGDCSLIGTWNGLTKTCKLSINVTDTIVIADADIILDGNSKAVIAGPGADAVNTDQSNVTIKNLTVTGSGRGIVFADTFWSFRPSGGTATNIIITGVASPYVVQGLPAVNASSMDITGGVRAVLFEDQFDGFDTDRLTLTNSTLKNATDVAIYASDSAVSATITRTNFINNVSDVTRNGATLTFSNASNRGNYWDKHTECGQNSTNQNYCQSPYSATGIQDDLPWRCANGWLPTVDCPIVVVPPTDVGVAPFYTQVDSRWASLLYDHSDTIKQTCSATTGYNLTIKQCGCYISSITNLLKIIGLRTADGGDVTPMNINSWLNANRGYTENGDLNPASVKKFTKQLDQPYYVAFEGGYNTSDYGIDYVRGKLDNTIISGVPGLVFVPKGHFILAVAKSSNTYAVQDPWWYNTSTLDDHSIEDSTHKNYNNQIRGVRIYSKIPAGVASKFLQFFLGSPAYLIINDPNNRKILYIPNSADSYSQIPNSSYWTDEIADPEYEGILNDESKFVWINNPVDGDYTVSVVGTGLGKYTFGVSGNDTAEHVVASSTNIGITDKYIVRVIGGLPQSIRPLTESVIDFSKRIEICHVPPGNFSKKHTIIVGEPAVRAHLSHGDYVGQCHETASQIPIEKINDNSNKTSKIKSKKI